LYQKELRLKAVLVEYERNELLKNMEVRTQLTAIMVSAAGVVGAVAMD
jgi:hypothetical protein